MILNVGYSLLVLVFFATVASGDGSESESETTESKVRRRIRKPRTPPPPQNITQASINTYLSALANFNVDSGSGDTFLASCRSLTSSLKSLLQFMPPGRSDQLTAPLYTFPTLRRDLFPDVQYRVTYRNYKPSNLGRIDVMIQRKDGALFAFKMGELAEATRILAKAEKKKPSKNATDEIFFRSIRRPLSHWVVASLSCMRHRYKLLQINASFILDTFDTTKAINVTVE